MITGPEKNSSLWTHLVELRRRLLFCFWAFLLGFILSYAYSNFLLEIFAKPLVHLFAGQPGRRFIYTNLTEAFATHLKVAGFGACLAACPVWAFQLWQFIAPALRPKEKVFYRGALAVMPLLFAAGAAVAYFIICPWAWKFFLSFESSMTIGAPLQFEAKISEYMATTLRLMTIFGLTFELPVILASLVVLGIVSLESLKRGRKYAFLVITVVAALLTPPDLISPLGLMVPVYGLYEGTILGLSILNRAGYLAPGRFAHVQKKTFRKIKR